MDLIDRMIRRLQHIEPAITATRAKSLEHALRREFGGESTRVRKRPKKDEILQAITAHGQSTSVAEVARKIGVHRTTVYRVLSSHLRSKRLPE
jgi:transcriptional regulator of acetoin/glycerol metabolism